jgi:PAS domain S-box-containing protein
MSRTVKNTDTALPGARGELTRGRLLALTLIPIAVILVVVLGLNLVTSTKRAIAKAEREAMANVATLSDRFDGELRRVSQVAEQTAATVATVGDLTEAEIYRLLENGVRQDPLIYGAAMGFVAGGFRDRPAFCPYVYRDGDAPGGLGRLDIAGAYDYLNDPEILWWQQPAASGRPVWSEPYFDEGAGNIMMSTYSVPFFRPGGGLWGVTTIDIPLEPLQAFVGTRREVLVLTSEGRYIHRTAGIPDGNPTIFELASDQPELLEIARRMVAGETGMGVFEDETGARQLVFFAPLSSAGWSFAMFLPEDEALAAAHRAGWWLAAALLLSLALIAAAMWFVSGLVWRTQVEVRAAEARFRALMESAPDAMVIVDQRGTIVMVNDQAERTFGYPRSSLLGQSVDMLVPERLRAGHGDKVRGYFTRPARREMGSGTELVGVRADGGEFPIEVSLSPFETPDGTLVSSVVRDITERRQAEQELTEQRILLASTFDTIPDIIFVKDRDGRYLKCNPACAEFMGRPVEDIVGSTDHELFGDEIGDDFRERDRLVIEGGERSTHEEWVTYPDGSRRLLETTKVPFRDCGGGMGGILGVSRDITERHLAAERLAEAEERSRLVLESTGEGIFGVDAQGRAMFANRAAAELLGYAKEELLGEGIHDLIHHSRIDGRPYPVEECPMHAAFTDGTASKVDDEVLWRKDGTAFAVEYTSTPLRKDRQLAGAVIVFRDITERKEAETALLQARDDALAANKAKSAFLANMSHELRTPMNAIIGYSEMLMEEAEDLELEDFGPDLEKIHRAGNHLLGLINDILDLSKIEAGKMQLYFERFSVGGMLQDIAATVEALVRKKNNRFEIRGAEGVGEMKSDLTKVRQTLFNLISNAAKFTENGEIVLSVRRERDEAAVEWLSFAVSDTGIGIPADKIDELFEEFTQADVSTTRKYGGTGLGLAITKRFCKLLGGSIEVRSEVGEGSTFTIRLPAEGTAAKPAAAETSALPESASPVEPAASDATRPVAGAASRGTVLVIDDDPTVRDLLSRNLHRDGYDVLLAENGERGLELARTHAPAAITLDVMMPGLDGWTVLRTLKADEATRDIPVIMITIVDDKTLGYTLGAAEYLPKPLDRRQLREALARLRTEGSGYVLVVDDEPDMRELSRRALEAEGLEVREAADGQEALEVIARRRPGLILLDLMMPVMDGFEFLLRLRQDPVNADLPVVVVTAKDLTAEDRARLDGHVTEVLQKGGLRQETLLQEVRRTLARVSGAGDEASRSS